MWFKERLITTTDSVEGYTVKEYLGIVTGTDIYLVGGLFGGGMANQEGLYGTALNTAINHMISKASNADAIIGVQNIVTSPGNDNNIIVVVTGTAVKLENTAAKKREEAIRKEAEERKRNTLPPMF